VTTPERLDHRDQGLRLGLVALEHGDLQREPARGDQQPDGDLRVDPALLAHADLAELVFLAHLEMQRGQSYITSATGPGADACVQHAVESWAR